MNHNTTNAFEVYSPNGWVKTKLIPTPKLTFQDGYIKPEFTQDQAATFATDLLVEGIISEDTFITLISQYPDELL